MRYREEVTSDMWRVTRSLLAPSPVELEIWSFSGTWILGLVLLRAHHASSPRNTEVRLNRRAALAVQKSGRGQPHSPRRFARILIYRKSDRSWSSAAALCR